MTFGVVIAVGLGELRPNFVQLRVRAPQNAVQTKRTLNATRTLYNVHYVKSNVRYAQVIHDVLMPTLVIHRLK